MNAPIVALAPKSARRLTSPLEIIGLSCTSGILTVAGCVILSFANTMAQYRRGAALDRIASCIEPWWKSV